MLTQPSGNQSQVHEASTPPQKQNCGKPLRRMLQLEQDVACCPVQLSNPPVLAAECTLGSSSSSSSSSPPSTASSPSGCAPSATGCPMAALIFSTTAGFVQYLPPYTTSQLCTFLDLSGHRALVGLRRAEHKASERAKLPRGSFMTQPATNGASGSHPSCPGQAGSPVLALPCTSRTMSATAHG